MDRIMAQRGACGQCLQNTVNCLLCIYLCNQLCAPRRNSGISMLAGFGSDASGDAEINQAMVPAATGGALGDLPLIACARMDRDEPGGLVDEQDFERA